ncbi:MAG: hypothetical protein ACFFFB_12315 [Candidatus Heimdallarchaeota archaeon]
MSQIITSCNMHGTQYHPDIIRHQPYITQETKTSKSYINSKVKSSEPLTKKYLPGVEFNWKI